MLLAWAYASERGIGQAGLMWERKGKAKMGHGMGKGVEQARGRGSVGLRAKMRGLSSFYFVFFYFKALFKLISKAFEFVLNFDQNHTSQ